MKVAIVGILIATYLTFSYKCKSLIFFWREQMVEISIISLLTLSVLFSYNSELFVWMLIILMMVHQVIQLTIEVSARLKRQKIEATQVEEKISLSA